MRNLNLHMLGRSSMRYLARQLVYRRLLSLNIVLLVVVKVPPLRKIAQVEVGRNASAVLVKH
jgi:hypothetical protein